jgi:hypothetical protein
MGFRTAAALTVVVIAIALVAAFVVGHRAPVGSVPSGQEQNAKAYRALVKSDYDHMAASTSNHCNTIDDTGCEAAANRVVAALQQWVDHLDSFRTPSPYAGLDGLLRRHLSAVAAELTAAVAFQKANDVKGFDLAMQSALYERDWINGPMYIITIGTYQRLTAASYREALTDTSAALDACVAGRASSSDASCVWLLQQKVCTGVDTTICLFNVEAAATQLQGLLIGLTQYPASGDLAKAGRLQADLVAADTALLAVTDALMKGDSARVESGRGAYAAAIVAASKDL